MSEEASSSSTKPVDDTPNLTEEHFALIAQAYDEFNGKRYNQSLQTLKTLEESIGNSDRKITHNKAVVEFYNSDFKHYDDFLKFLDKEINDINQSQVEPHNNRNLPVLYFNKAVILYHLRKPYAALNCLTPFVDKFDKLDESISKKIGFLFLSLLLETNQLKKSYQFLKKFEIHIGYNADIHSFDEEKKGSNSDLSSSKNNYEDFKRNFKLISLLINIVNQKHPTIPDEMTMEFSFLKAHQYYIEKDYQMAAKQLSRKFPTESISLETHGVDPNTCIANNMGVIHLRVRHYAIATKFFQHAICFDNEAIKKFQIEKPLYVVGASKKAEIFYNLGIAMLHLQRPNDAFECFLIPLQNYHQNPRLWHRIAEACIMANEQKNGDSDKKSIISAVIGSGIHRKYVLEPTNKIKYPNQPSVDPAPTLEFAAFCLQNAVTLTENYKAELAKQIQKSDETEDKNWKNVQDENFCNPSIPISMKSLDRLLVGIYTAYSFVSIRLGDYTVGLDYAKKILNMENLSDVNIMLGHLYCAEALIHLNRLNEARAYLEPKFITNLNPQHFEIKDWQINSVEVAQAVLKYNLVVTLVLQGEFGVAKALLVSCNHPFIAKHCKMLKMFMDIAEDNSVDSNIKLKTQRF